MNLVINKKKSQKKAAKKRSQRAALRTKTQSERTPAGTGRGSNLREWTPYMTAVALTISRGVRGLVE